MRSPNMVAVAVIGMYALAPDPAARADNSVTYEVVSADISAVGSIEYFDGSMRQLLEDVALPWRATVTMANPLSLAADGAEVRADWRRSIAGPVLQPGRWVTVRIYVGEALRCQNTLDVGNAACYGSTSFKS